MVCSIDVDLVNYSLWLLYLLKLYYDAGNKEFISLFEECCLDSDDFYAIIWEALEYAAPIAEMIPVLDENGEEVDDSDVFIWRFSSDEMKRCYRLLKLIHKMNGGNSESNPRIGELNREIEELKHFYSYSFDYEIHIQNKDAYIEVTWDYEFSYELHMCIWIARAMKVYREYLPELETEFKKLRCLGRKSTYAKQNEEVVRSAA